MAFLASALNWILIFNWCNEKKVSHDPCLPLRIKGKYKLIFPTRTVIECYRKIIFYLVAGWWPEAH